MPRQGQSKSLLDMVERPERPPKGPQTPLKTVIPPLLMERKELKDRPKPKGEQPFAELEEWFEDTMNSMKSTWETVVQYLKTLPDVKGRSQAITSLPLIKIFKPVDVDGKPGWKSIKIEIDVNKSSKVFPLLEERFNKSLSQVSFRYNKNQLTPVMAVTPYRIATSDSQVVWWTVQSKQEDERYPTYRHNQLSFTYKQWAFANGLMNWAPITTLNTDGTENVYTIEDDTSREEKTDEENKTYKAFKLKFSALIDRERLMTKPLIAGNVFALVKRPTIAETDELFKSLPSRSWEPMSATLTLKGPSTVGDGTSQVGIVLATAKENVEAFATLKNKIEYHLHTYRWNNLGFVIYETVYKKRDDSRFAYKWNIRFLDDYMPKGKATFPKVAVGNFLESTTRDKFVAWISGQSLVSTESPKHVLMPLPDETAVRKSWLVTMVAKK